MVLFIGGTYKRHDISQNWLKYAGYFVLSLMVMSFVDKSSLGSGLPTTSIFAKVIFSVFIVGMSETLMQVGLLQKYKNRAVVNTAFGFLHVGAYMALTGATSFDFTVFMMCLKSVVGFFVFDLAYYFTGDIFIVSILHGVYDLILIY